MREVESITLLGPFSIVAGGAPIVLPRRHVRLVLGLLLLEAGRPVATEKLIRLVWPARVPTSARDVLQTYVSRVRTSLRDVQGISVLRTGDAYMAATDPHLVDAHRFRDLVARASDTADPRLRSDLTRGALALWRGPALADTGDNQTRAVACAGLEELRQHALDMRIVADLELGRHEMLIGELTDLLAGDPLNERLTGQLALAMYRSGRRAEALAVCREMRARLRRELGLDPGPKLQQIEVALLRDEPPSADIDATGVTGGTSGAPTRRPVPHQEVGSAGGDRSVPTQLPAGTAGFVGRADALAQLDKLVEAGGPNPTVVISAVSGMAGIGKTTLAVHWARRVAGHFPPGQLYTNLRGFGPAGAAATPAEVMLSFLDALEVPAQRVPAGLDAQTALYRSLMADRRMLVLLDNARDADQVRPLLPGAPGCLVLVTSRNHLTGLIASAGAVPLPLDLLNHGEARDLLAQRLGADRIAAEPAAVEEIIERCARLPLALAIVAARAATQPQLTLTALAAELRHPRDRLDTLAIGDAATDVRSVFSWSYQQLSGPAARLFRLLGVHPGPDLSVSAAASIAGIPPGPVRPLVAELVRVHLVTEPVPGRYGLHDLLRAYASELAASEEPDTDRQEAVRRLLDHYLRSAHRAATVQDPTRDPIEPIPPAAGVRVDEFESTRAATDWLAAEYQVLMAVVRLAVDAGLDRHAWQLVWSIAPFVGRHRGYRDAIALHRIALDASQRLSDPAAQAYSHRLLGRAHTLSGEHDQARAHLKHALETYRQLGDDTNQAHVHLALGIVLELQGRLRDALHQAEQALARYQTSGHPVGLASALNNVGWYHARLGDYETALQYCQQALRLYQKIGDRAGEADTWDSLGLAYHQLGRHTDAVAAYQHALAVFRDNGDRYNEANTLMRLGDTYQASGDTGAARDTWQEALAISTDLDHPDAEQVRARLCNTIVPDT